jgi:hypothetical protein
MFTGRAKPIRIIGVLNNQRPDKRSAIVVKKRHVSGALPGLLQVLKILLVHIEKIFV